MTKNKQKIAYVFKQNPFLSRLGSERKYLKYLESIFPKSKVKQILYHGTPYGEVEEFERSRQGPSSGFFFSDSLEHANKVSEWKYGDPRVKYVILNMEKPLKERFIPSLGIKETKPEVIERAKKTGNDGLILETKDLGIEIEEYIALKPEQIHILGSRRDIQGFRKYVKTEGNSYSKSNSLENKVALVFFMSIFLVGLFLSSPILTGNIISNPVVDSTKFIGIPFLILGILGIFFFRKKEAKRRQQHP